jgi:hypothetical protein
MVITLYLVESEILNDLDAPDRDKLLRKAADAFRARAACLRRAGRAEAALVDLKRAAVLEADAIKLARKKTERGGVSPPVPAVEPPPATGRIQFVNDWSQAVEVVVDGVNYQVPAGDQKVITKPAGSFSYEVPIANHRSTGNVEAGKTFKIWIGNR